MGLFGIPGGGVRKVRRNLKGSCGWRGGERGNNDPTQRLLGKKLGFQKIEKKQVAFKLIYLKIQEGNREDFAQLPQKHHFWTPKVFIFFGFLEKKQVAFKLIY